MSTKTRPSGCCIDPVAPAELPLGQEERIVNGFKALADQTRLAVFRLIASQDAPICACDVADRFDVSQPTISHHLRVLRDAGLVTVSRQGIWAYYQADPRAVDRLRAFLAGFAVAETVAAD